MVRIINKKLTQEQLKKNVIFSSCLSETRNEDNYFLHEVFKVDEANFKTKPTYELIKEREEQQNEIRRLRDTKFFNNSHFKFNIVRT